MTDTEKGGELPKEGMDMNNEKLFELREKKESSLAADQESVTGNQNPDNSINGSSIEESGSSEKNEPHESSLNDESGDSPASKIPDKDKKREKEDPPIAPQTEIEEDNTEPAQLKPDTTDSEKSNRGNNSEEIIPPANKDSIETEDETEPVSESSEQLPVQNNEITEEESSANKETSDTNKNLLDQQGEEIEPGSNIIQPETTEKKSEPSKKVAQAETKQPSAEVKESEIVETEASDTTKSLPDEEKESPTTPTDSSDEVNKEQIKTKGDQSDKDKAVDSKDSKDSKELKEKDAGKGIETTKPSDTEVKEAAKNEVAEEEHQQEEEIEEDKDYSVLKKDELINEFESLHKIDDIKLAEKKIKELKPFYQQIVESEKKEALQKFLDDGGVEIDFKYVGDALDSRYANLNDKYKGRRNAYYSELEKNKEDNLVRKQEILEKLRAIVDGEETNASISALKNITKEWRSIGPVPSAYAKSMWATYNILIDRFYDNRSIYFELKELDRKKNLESKIELCEKAEQLLEYEVIRDAVKELNELHEEFKHIGPVPKEMQEVVWQRFKSASDAVYNRRKDYVSGLKKELHENLETKKQLVEEVAKFNDFDSDKISEWNEKTKDILDLQKKWESIGGLPREHAKEINKHFWSSFKSFFNNKNKFFKKLESQRDDNLLKKEDLVKRAEELQESSVWEKTAEQLKELQREWKDIGPVPEKNRNEVYKKFKKACDTFFNKRREHSKEVESEYKVNLKKKEEICAEIEKMVGEKDKNVDRFKELQLKFNEIGFVPRNTIKRINKKFNHATELFLNSFDLSDTEKSELRFAAEVDKLKASPNADRRIYRKEIEVKRLISKLENDIALWKNNIEFFAKSKNADKVRAEFNEKIAQATSQLKELREELKVLNKI